MAPLVVDQPTNPVSKAAAHTQPAAPPLSIFLILEQILFLLSDVIGFCFVQKWISTQCLEQLAANLPNWISPLRGKWTAHFGWNFFSGSGSGPTPGYPWKLLKKRGLSQNILNCCQTKTLARLQIYLFVVMLACAKVQK